MKQNYQPWEINIDDFCKFTDERENIKFLLKFAALAPSAHNCQPWDFRIENGTITIFKNKERSLEHGDASGRQVAISIGCALENILVAADFYGMAVENIDYSPSGSEGMAVIKFGSSGTVKNDKNHLIHFIAERRTNRGKFKDIMPSHDFLNTIKNFTNDQIGIFIISKQEKAQKDAITNLVTKAQIEAMDSHHFRRELSTYIKHSFTKEKVGMPGSTLGVPTPVSLFLSRLIKGKNVSRFSEKQDNLLLKDFTPVFVVLAGKNDNQENWVKAGQLLEKIWLKATLGGMACAPLAAVVEQEKLRKELQSVLRTNMKPLVFLRLGYPVKEYPHSPRLSFDELVIR